MSCANRGTPTGGDIDEQAPIVLKAEPANFSTDFNVPEIEIQFDEYIRLNNLQNELIISPPIEPAPLIMPMSSASKIMTISGLDSLNKNATYSFHFGESIQDNNERNPLTNYRYVFSTGKYIDSLKIKGSVKDAINREIGESINILLYEVDSLFNDSIIYKRKPKYVGKVVDTTAIFSIQNIKKGKYLIIALEEENKDYIYQNKVDKIGFSKDIIELPNDSIKNLTVFKESLPFKVGKPKQRTNKSFAFGYEGDYEPFDIKIINSETIKYNSRIIKDSKSDSLIYFLKTEANLDSIVFEVINEKILDSLKIRIKEKENDSLVIKSMQNKTLKFNDEFIIEGNIPFEKIEEDKISIMNKDSIFIDFEYKLDSLNNQYKFSFDKLEEEEYSIKLLPGAITDFYNSTNDTILYRVKTKTYNDYGNLRLNLRNAKYPILIQLVSSSGEKKYEIYSKNLSGVDFTNIDPGKYFIRIIYDQNKNNRYDSGNYLKKIYPEKVIYYPDEIDVRAGWDLVQEFILQ